MKRTGFSKESRERSAKKARAKQKQRKPLKQTPMKRKPKKRRINSPYGTKKGKRLRGREIDIANSQAFHQAARDQRVCAVCGKAGAFQAHHVIEKKFLRDNWMPLYDTENSLRVCPEPCHGQHTRRSKKIKLTMLLDRNIAYAFRKMGVRAYNYLKANYDGEDARVERALAELETPNG